MQIMKKMCLLKHSNANEKKKLLMKKVFTTYKVFFFNCKQFLAVLESPDT